VEPAEYEQWGRAVVDRAADLSSQVVHGLRRAGLID